jgi:hypothetical protein
MGFRLSSRDLWKLLSLLFEENGELVLGVLLRFESLFEDELLLRLWPTWWLLGVDGDAARCCLMLLLLVLFSIGDGDCDGSGGNGGIGKPGNFNLDKIRIKLFESTKKLFFFHSEMKVELT